MDATTFLKNFATIAEAPGGVQRLKALTLNLAVSGRLVQQDPADEPVEILVDRIASDHPSLGPARSGAVKMPPFEIPSSWFWLPLDRATHLEMGQSPPSSTYNESGDGMPFFQGKADFGLTHPTVRYWCTSPTKVAEPGDVLISVRAPVGPSNIADQACCIGRGLAAIRPLGGMPTRFLRYVIQALEKDLAAMGTGTTFVAISRKNLAPFQVPIPPLDEQERIVAKLDELMGLCDEFGASQKRRHRASTRFRGSALHALTEADTPDDLRHAWERVSANWLTLTCCFDSVADIRRTIIHLAVQGKLATQDLHEQSASKLLAEVAEQQLQLKAEGRLPGVRLPILAPSIPAPALPENWTWTRLGAVLRHCRNGLATKPNEDGAGFPLLRISAGTSDPDGLVDLDDHKFADIDGEAAAPYVLDVSDLLACRFNGNLRYVGRVARVPEHEGTYLHPDKLIRMKAMSVDHRFLSLALNSPGTREQIERAASTTAGNIGINGAQLQALHIPLPPLPEQSRIAERVERLFRLCARLAQALPKADRAADRTGAGVVGALGREWASFSRRVGPANSPDRGRVEP